VRDSQEKVVQSLQQYTTTNYPSMPTKFGELLLRMPELQRVCQVRDCLPLLFGRAVVRSTQFLCFRSERKCSVRGQIPKGKPLASICSWNC
jgi:hypothetical protein